MRALLFVFFFGLTAAVVGVNGWLAYRFRPVFRSISLEQQSLDRYRIALDPFRKLALVAVSGLFGFFVGTSALAEWRSFLLWQNATAVGRHGPAVRHRPVLLHVRAALVAVPGRCRRW